MGRIAAVIEHFKTHWEEPFERDVPGNVKSDSGLLMM